MVMNFRKATKQQIRLRLALIGSSGSGKTYTALNIAKHLGGKVAVIDTERGSASKYADLFEFDALELQTFNPLTYVEAIKAAEQAGYQILVIDSLSHAWMGKEGALEQVDKIQKRSQSNNSFTAWRDVTPMHNALVDAILQCNCHIIATMRAKTEYVMEVNEKGKNVPRKIGIAPIQRDGLEYEFDVVADMDFDNNLIVSKTRCPALSGEIINKPGKEIAETLRAWLTDGEPAQPKPAAQTKPEPSPKPSPEPANNTRPYLPDQLKAALNKRAELKQGKSASKEQRGLTAAMLDLIFQDEAKRHTFQLYACGGASLSDLPDAMILSLLDWLAPKKDSGGNYTPDAMAEREAKMAYTEALKAEGQAELFNQ